MAPFARFRSAIHGKGRDAPLSATLAAVTPAAIATDASMVVHEIVMISKVTPCRTKRARQAFVAHVVIGRWEGVRSAGSVLGVLAWWSCRIPLREGQFHACDEEVYGGCTERPERPSGGSGHHRYEGGRPEGGSEG